MPKTKRQKQTKSKRKQTESKQNRTKKANKIERRKQTKANGSGPSPLNDLYYLATSCRHPSPITELRPFGSLNECERIYNEKYSEEVNILKMQKQENDEAVQDVRIVGTSQYGLFFRLVKKDLLQKPSKMIPSIVQESDEENFVSQRSFVFEIDKLLEYIQKKANELNIQNIPVFWYSRGNYYGYQYMTPRSVMCSKDTVLDNLCTNIMAKVQTNRCLYEHECVSRLSIPLTPDAGYVGKIPNFSILYLEHYDDEFVLTKNLKKKNRDVKNTTTTETICKQKD